MHFVQSVAHVSAYKLQLLFEDGSVRLVDLESHLDGEIFAPLQDVDYFKTVRVDSDLDTIAWDNGADISPDFLYEIGKPIAESALVTKVSPHQPEEDQVTQARAAIQPVDYAQAIAKLVAKMSVERAAQVYDFACFLQTRSGRDDDDWLNDSEEQMQAEDTLWDAASARHSDKFAALAQAARAEIEAGPTRPMFDEHGEFVDELSHDSELSEGI
jgi:hypothetical protein